MRWRVLTLILAGAMPLLLGAAPVELEEPPAQFVLPPGHDLQFSLPSYVWKAVVRVRDRQGNEKFIYGTRRNPQHVNQPPSGGTAALCSGSGTFVEGENAATHSCHIWGVQPDRIVWIEMYDVQSMPIVMEDMNPTRKEDTKGYAALRCADDGKQWVCKPKPWHLVDGEK